MQRVGAEWRRERSGGEAEGVGGTGGSADRASDREHAVVRGGRRRTAAAEGERGRAVDRRSGSSQRVCEAGGADGGAVHCGSVPGRSGSEGISDGRPGEVAGERRVAVHRTPGRAGEGAWVSDRVGRDRGGAGGAGGEKRLVGYVVPGAGPVRARAAGAGVGGGAGAKQEPYIEDGGGERAEKTAEELRALEAELIRGCREFLSARLPEYM